ncbi:MAG TPA: glutamate synthase, partial [Myxococcota bacterium]|nr:glutamate synthase [Myxococcota bacterium]
SSQEEGGEREFAVMTKRFLGDANGRLRAIEAVRVEWDVQKEMHEVPGNEFDIECDLALLAMGFLGPEAQAWSGLPI